jgi:2-iminobutanoate/2-iminopropanoate deaminase
MGREHIIAPGVYAPVGGAHAVQVDGVVYSAAIGPLDREGGLVGSGSLGAQAAQVYRNLEAVLHRAGAGWEDVVKVHTYVAPQVLTGTGRRELREVEERYRPAGRWAELSVSLPLQEPDWLIAVDLVAYRTGAKQPISGVPGVAAPPGAAHAVRVGDFVYLGAQVPADVRALAGARNGVLAATGDTTTQIRTAYGHQGNILAHAGLSWDDVFKVQQYVTRTDLDLNDMQAARGAYLTLGRFLSTSVVCEPEHPRWPLEGWLLAVDMEAYVGPKEHINAPGVWGNPKGPQAMKIGKTIYMHGQVAREEARKTLYPDDARAQAELSYRNLDGILKAAGADWSHVVHVKTFCKRREDLAIVRQVRSRWLRDGQYASTDLVSAFFDPVLLVETELLTVTD